MLIVDEAEKNKKIKLYLWVCLERENVIWKKCIFGIKMIANNDTKFFNII